MKKLIRSIILILITGLLLFMSFKGCSYLDLQVSEKYETQLEGVTKSPELLQEAMIKAVAIEKEKKRIKREVAIGFVAIPILLIGYLYSKSRSSK